MIEYYIGNIPKSKKNVAYYRDKYFFKVEPCIISVDGQKSYRAFRISKLSKSGRWSAYKYKKTSPINNGWYKKIEKTFMELLITFQD